MEKTKCVDSWCNGCIYRQMFSTHALGCCGYILTVGKSRGCPAGTGCNKKETKRGKKK